MNKLLCIVTTGRSGSSLLANLASSINFNLSDQLFGSNFTNIKGHFEDLNIMSKNDHFLGRINKKMWDTIELTDVQNNLFRDKYKTQIINYLSRVIDSKKNLLLKEPRISKLFHLYQEIFDELDCEIFFIYLYRSPMLYSKSTFNAYRNVDLKLGTKIWFYHNYNILNNFRETDNILKLNFSKFIQDMPFYCSEISKFVEEKIDQNKFDEYRSKFYDEKLVNFKDDEKTNIKHIDEFYSFIENLNFDEFVEMKQKLSNWNLEKILK